MQTTHFGLKNKKGKSGYIYLFIVFQPHKQGENK